MTASPGIPGFFTWSPAQARYDRHAMVVTTTSPDTPEAPGVPQHFVPTLHGVLARTWLCRDMTELHLRRPSNSGVTYQGTVRAVEGGWAGFDPNGEQVTAVYTDYIYAEAPLLPRRTNWRSSVKFNWPHDLLTARKEW